MAMLSNVSIVEQIPIITKMLQKRLLRGTKETFVISEIVR